MSKEDKNIDDKFKDAFDGFQATPSQKSWDNVESGIDSDIDQYFNENLKSLEVTPQPQVWENIKEELPLHPEARRYFSWMNKVAAVLVIGMLLCILSDQQKQQLALKEKKAAPAQTIDLQMETPAAFSSEPSTNEFVYEFSNHSNSKSVFHTLESEEEAEIKQLLQFILEDDEDLADQIDSAVVRESFAPATAPSGKTATTDLGKKKMVAPDFEIKIPLKVVETEQEANKLLRIYDSGIATTKTID